jgi:energy-coupling factor transporter ATP-binding protein EcfA2
MREIQVRDVGPIRSLSIPIPDEGGVVVLAGLNGQGKTRALQAVQRLTGQKVAVDVRDGMPSGSVEGLGARVTVGRRTTTAGELGVATLEGEDPSKLVDPGIADPAAADARRIRALCRLARVELSLMDFAPLVEGADLEDVISHRTRACVGGDPVELARSFEADLHRRATALKDQAEATMARASAIRQAHADIDVNGPTDLGALEEAELEAMRAMERIRGQWQQQKEAQSKAQIARQKIAELFQGADLEESLRAAEEQLQRHKGDLDAAVAAVSDANRRLAEAQRAYARSADEANRWRKAQQQHAQLLADVSAEAEVEVTVTEADVDQARAEFDAARAARLNGALLSKAWKDLQDADQAEKDARVLGKESARYREAADACDTVLSNAIAKVAPRGLRVHGGRLCIETGRGLTVFDNLSTGERWRLALDVAIDATGEGGLLVIDQEAWEALDPINREAIHAHAKSRRTVILTAECDAGELRAQVFTHEPKEVAP